MSGTTVYTLHHRPPRVIVRDLLLCRAQVLTALAVSEEGVVLKATESGLTSALDDIVCAVGVAQPEAVCLSQFPSAGCR